MVGGDSWGMISTPMSHHVSASVITTNEEKVRIHTQGAAAMGVGKYVGRRLRRADV